MAAITKRGTRWSVQIRRKGFPPQFQTFATKQLAVQWATEQEAAILNGRTLTLPRIDPSLTLGSLVERYLERVTPTKRSGETEGYRLRKLLRDPVCETLVVDFSPVVFANYRDSRCLVVRAGTVRREISLLRNILDIARREWGIPILANPVAEVSKPRVRNARTRRLADCEWKILRRSLAQSRNPWLLPVVQFAIETALRRGEILDLCWSRIDRQTSTALIPITKTDRPRIIPLTPAAIDLLDDLPRRGEKVFPITTNALKHAWVRAINRAKIVDLHFHDLRHEAVSRFFEMGLSLPEVALISGHRDPRMLMRYTHLSSSNLAMKLAQLCNSGEK